MVAVAATMLLVLSLSGLVITAAMKQPVAYAGIVALSNLMLTGLAIWSQYRLEEKRATRAALAADSARHIAYAWIFGALSLLCVYGFILSWREWLTFSVAMLAVGGLSYGLSRMFSADAERGRIDAAMLGLGRNLNLAQVIGMIIAMIGLSIDGKMKVAVNASRSDWAANSTFFFGALAIALIGAWLLVTDRRASQASGDSGAPPSIGTVS